MDFGATINQNSPPKVIINTALFAFFVSASFIINAHNNPIYGMEGVKTAYIPPAVILEPRKVNEEVNLEQAKQKWNESVRQRYRNSKILTIETGIKHMQMVKYINSRPVRINVIEVNQNLNNHIKMMPEMASSFSLQGRRTIRTIAQRNGSVAAINCTYFKPTTGTPLGLLMKDGKILTGPIYDRVAMGIGNNEFKMDRVKLDAKFYSGSKSVKIDNINQPRMLASYALVYTSDWGKYSPATPKYGLQIAVENNTITKVSTAPLEIPTNGYVISAPAKLLEPMLNEKKVKLEVKTQPDWKNINHIISGGPYLLKEGNVYVDVQAQKLNSITGRNPRTAIGYTKDNNLILVTVDGRENNSVGMTLTELANFMKSIGAYEAMNLDGGGSSVMYVKGNIVNNPAQKGGIALSNAFVINIDKTETVVNK